jgi:glycosyltransferase involved in cell wall biosynthesis
MGDGWAGAEVQLSILLASLAKMPDFEISAVLFNEGRLASELRGFGVRTQVISESRHNSFSMVKQLIDYFRQHEFDILHTHKYKDNILGALSSVYREIRRVRTVHGLPEPFIGFQAVKISAYQLVDNWVNRWLVDQILAVSLDLRSHLIKHFGAEKVTCIQNAIDIEQIRVTKCATELRKELKLGGQEFLIGTMGRLMPVKGLESFLKAAEIIRRQKPNVKFIIAGDGPLKRDLQAKAREYGLDKDVLFLGHRNDSHDILGLMDVFVLPSVSEGIPMVLLEALALARPVIASRVGGIPEVIEDGVSGLLVTPGREDELAQSCVALMDNYNFAQQLGIAGRKRVEERFSARVMAEKVAEVYRTLVCDGESR